MTKELLLQYPKERELNLPDLWSSVVCQAVLEGYSLKREVIGNIVTIWAVNPADPLAMLYQMEAAD